MEDRRRHRRIKINNTVRLNSATYGNHISCVAVDISLGGVGVHSHGSCAMNAYLWGDLLLPVNYGNNGIIEFNGITRNINKNIENYKLGIEFTDLKLETKAGLEKFIAWKIFLAGKAI